MPVFRLRRRPTLLANRKSHARRARVELLEGRALLATAPVVAPLPPVAPAPAPAPVETAPTIAAVQFQPLLGRVQITYLPGSTPLNLATLANTANYELIPIGKVPGPTGAAIPKSKVHGPLAPQFVVTGVSVAATSSPTAPQVVTVSVNNNQGLRAGLYFFAIKGTGILDVDGTPLDGAYSGTFPTGGNSAGSDFAAVLGNVNNTALPAIPVVPATNPPAPGAQPPSYVFEPSTRAVRIRYTSSTPGGFMLAGGNHIKLVALGRQFFPGTFRLPANLFNNAPLPPAP
jgi:hypothetical protein